MDIKVMVDAVRASASNAGVNMPMARGRDLASRYMFGKPFSAAMAASAAGKLEVASGISLARQSELDGEFGKEISDAYFGAALTQLGMRYREHLRVAPQVRHKFRAVHFLVVRPDVDGEFGKRGKVPWVDMNSLNFAALTECFKSNFRHSVETGIYSVDDYIDVVSIETRKGVDGGKALELHDYAGTVRTPTLRISGEVVRVADRWAPLHTRLGGPHLPPPSVLAVASEHYNYEEFMEWERYVRSLLGYVDFMQKVIAEATGSGKNIDQREPTLPSGVASDLESIFGVPFLPQCLLARMNHSRFPGWVERMLVSE